jgi:hypothetical protein
VLFGVLSRVLFGEARDETTQQFVRVIVGVMIARQ